MRFSRFRARCVRRFLNRTLIAILLATPACVVIDDFPPNFVCDKDSDCKDHQTCLTDEEPHRCVTLCDSNDDCGSCEACVIPPSGPPTCENTVCGCAHAMQACGPTQECCTGLFCVDGF